MRYETYYESVEFQNGKAHFSVEYVLGNTRYTADGATDNVSEAYARIREHRAEFRKELNHRDRITAPILDEAKPSLTKL